MEAMPDPRAVHAQLAVEFSRSAQRENGAVKRKKRPPERPRPRGAKDTTLFREQLEGSIAAWHGHPARDLPL